MAAIDIDMSEFTQKTTLASTDFITGTLADGSAVKIKVSDLASVVAGMMTPNQIMCKPNAFSNLTIGWKHLCKVSIGGLAIVSGRYKTSRPSTYVLNYNAEGGKDINLIAHNGIDNYFNKFRLSFDSDGNKYLDVYASKSDSNVCYYTVLDVDRIDITCAGQDATECTLIGNELVVS